MNYQIIPQPKKIIINEKTEAPVIKEEELFLSEELKIYVKKAEEVCPFHGEKPVVLALESDIGTEEYCLDITAEQVTVKASAPQGAYCVSDSDAAFSVKQRGDDCCNNLRQAIHAASRNFR